MDEEREFEGYDEVDDFDQMEEGEPIEGAEAMESEAIPEGEGYITEEQRRPNERRVTKNTMTKYERARLIGARAVQLAHGAPLAEIERRGATDPLELARIELLEKKIPFIIRRYLPDGSFEDWKISEMEDIKTDFDVRR